MGDYTSKGVASSDLGLGIAGTAIHSLYDEHKEDEGLSLDQIHCLRRALQSILIVHQIKKS